MHRLIHPQPFDVRPRQHAGALPRHPLGIEQRLKRDVLRLLSGSHASSSGNEKPSQGTTIDHASTQRMR